MQDSQAALSAPFLRNAFSAGLRNALSKVLRNLEP